MNYIKMESENQKSGLILLVLFHSACPYKYLTDSMIICDRPRENQAYCAKNDFGVKSTMAIYDV